VKLPDFHARLDLNLVRVFVAIYETGSVSGAAARLFVTQSTVSYGLSKLREALHDPLFTRVPEGMTPTVLGELTYKKFSAAMANIGGAIEMTRRFDPQTSTQRFRIAMSDIGELIFLPPILERLQREAPGVELEVVQVAVDEVAGWLAAGKVDMAVGNLAVLQVSGKSLKLFSERYVCLLRKDHDGVGAELDLEAFVAARHILVSSPFSGHRLIEDVLQQHGVSRKIALQIPHFTILPRLLAKSDLLVTLPSRVARLFESYAPLRSLELPIAIPSFEVRMFWHEHQEENARHRWLRETIAGTLGNL
jgi:DNA-binding transcriptional LysR family regulator